MIGQHRLTAEEFAALSRGVGDADVIATLRGAQLSRHLLLIRYLAQAWTERAEREATVDVLAEAQATAPETFREVIANPMIGAWAANTARRVRGIAPATEPIELDLRQLSAIAVAAAVRCGIDADLPVTARGGAVRLPSLGAAPIHGADTTPTRVSVRDGRITIRCDGGRVTVADPGSDQSPTWQPMRWLGAGQRSAVMLDDLDRYRDGHHVPATGRLDPAQVERWRDRFAAAWRLIEEQAPDRTAELAAGLRTIVPLVDAGDGSARSATPRDAFGAFGLTLPPTVPELAVTLVHEFQHSKLNGVLDLVPLYESTPSPTFFAPWRPDPRPVAGLYQGVYAFLGVAGMWHALRTATGLDGLATREFAVGREYVHCGLKALETSGLLTASGRRFAAGLRATLTGLFRVELPAPVVAEARAALAGNRAAWRKRHGRTD